MNSSKHTLAAEEPPIHKRAKLDDTQLTSTRRSKNCAIFLVYSGWGYYGMQKNDGFATIEGDLLNALHKAGYVTKEQALVPSLIQFQRTSKTDKNVSAAGQVCNAKLPFTHNISVDSINEHLPDKIRVLDVFRVTKKFHPKFACNHREYQYLLPTFAFAPRDSITKRSCWQYRLPAERLTLANNLFLRYKGTHNFFNFTSRRTADDKSCLRYIMSMECGTRFLLDGDKEFALITVRGQSFMLHQIRKMIGLVIAILRGHTSEAIFESAFQTVRLDLPKAPGLGLLLDKVDFTRYNERHCADGSHKPIDWHNYEQEIEEFKTKHIFRHMVEKEITEDSMFNWLLELDRHTFDGRQHEELTKEKTSTTADDPSLEKTPVTAAQNPCTDELTSEKPSTLNSAGESDVEPSGDSTAQAIIIPFHSKTEPESNKTVSTN